MGPPGCGKSTLASRLISSSKNSCGLDYSQYFFSSRPLRYKYGYYLLSFITKNKVKPLIKETSRGEALYTYISNNPRFVSEVGQIVKRMDSLSVTVFFFYGASKQQIAQSMSEDGRLIIIDEGLYHYGAHGLSKTKGDLHQNYTHFSSYFDTIPTPHILVNVDASIETSLERQKKRGEEINRFDRSILKKQKRHRQACGIVAEKTNSKTITIQNDSSVDSSMKKLLDKLERVS